MREISTSSLIGEYFYIAAPNVFLVLCASIAVRAIFESVKFGFKRSLFRGFGIGVLAVISSVAPVAAVATHPVWKFGMYSEKVQFIVVLLGGSIFAYGYLYHECYRFALGASKHLYAWKEHFPKESEPAMASATHRILLPACIEFAFTISLAQMFMVGAAAHVPPSPSAGGGPQLDASANHFFEFFFSLVAIRVAATPSIRALDPTGFALRNLFIASMDDSLGRSSLIKMHWPEKPVSSVGSTSFTNTTMSRWRSRKHKASVLASNYLLRSTAGIDRKFSKTDVLYIRSTCVRLSYILRVRGVEDGARDGPDFLSGVCICIARIILGDNPIAACRDAEELTSSYEVPDVEYMAGNRFTRMLASVEGFIERNSKVLLVSLGVAVFAGYVHSIGSITIALERLFPIFGGK